MYLTNVLIRKSHCMKETSRTHLIYHVHAIWSNLLYVPCGTYDYLSLYFLQYTIAQGSVKVQYDQKKHKSNGQEYFEKRLRLITGVVFLNVNYLVFSHLALPKQINDKI